MKTLQTNPKCIFKTESSCLKKGLCFLCEDQIQQRLSELWPARIFAQHSRSSLRRKAVLFLAESRDSILCDRGKKNHLCVGVVCVGSFVLRETFYKTRFRVDRVKPVERERRWYQGRWRQWECLN